MGSRLQFLILILSSLVLLVAPVSVASGQTLTTDITITKGDAVKISNIDDWDFGIYAADATTTTAIRFFDETCVFSSTGGYSLQVVSQNGGTRLHLENGAGDELLYSLRLRVRVGTQLRNRNFNSSPVTLAGLAASSVLDCSDQGAQDWNLRFRTSIARNRFNNAPAGIYTDQVTIIVTPE